MPRDAASREEKKEEIFNTMVEGIEYLKKSNKMIKNMAGLLNHAQKAYNLRVQHDPEARNAELEELVTKMVAHGKRINNLRDRIKNHNPNHRKYSNPKYLTTPQQDLDRLNGDLFYAVAQGSLLIIQFRDLTATLYEEDIYLRTPRGRGN